MPELDVDGATLYYETVGHISALAVLLIHADADDVLAWDPRIETLATGGFVIRLLPESTPGADPVDLLDHLGILRATLLHSAPDAGRSERLVTTHPDRFALGNPLD
jgi:3-oxoadipate enol-lactonase